MRSHLLLLAGIAVMLAACSDSSMAPTASSRASVAAVGHNNPHVVVKDSLRTEWYDRSDGLEVITTVHGEVLLEEKIKDPKNGVVKVHIRGRVTTLKIVGGAEKVEDAKDSDVPATNVPHFGGAAPADEYDPSGDDGPKECCGGDKALLIVLGAAQIGTGLALKAACTAAAEAPAVIYLWEACVAAGIGYAVATEFYVEQIIVYRDCLDAHRGDTSCKITLRGDPEGARSRFLARKEGAWIRTA